MSRSLLDDIRGAWCGCNADEGNHVEERCIDALAPRIEAAIAAAERLINDGITPTVYDDQHGAFCTFCSAKLSEEAHSTGCLWQALVAALRGEP